MCHLWEGIPYSGAVESLSDRMPRNLKGLKTNCRSCEPTFIINPTTSCQETTMNFNFHIQDDTLILLGKLDIIRFEKARKGPNSYIHREWMRDVFAMFAQKAEVTLPQAIQLVHTGQFYRAHRMHGLHWERTPSHINKMVDGKIELVPNPVHVRYEALKNMRPEDNHDFIRNAFSWAISLRHPEQHVGALKPSDTAVQKVNKNNLKHPDELPSAHKRRTQIALQLFLDTWGGDITHDQMVKMGDQLGLGKV